MNTFTYKGVEIERIAANEYVVRTEEGILIHVESLEAAQAAIDNIYG